MKKNRLITFTGLRLKGFTLIEILIAVTLFTFVTYVAIGALFSMQILNQKLKATKVVYDNMHLTMDAIISDIKQGNNFTNTSPHVSIICITTSCIFFDHLNVETNNKLEKRGYYLKEGHIVKYYKANSGDVAKNQNITSDDLIVENLKFELVGTDTYEMNDTQQPMVKIIIEGKTRTLPVTPFHIENMISQRSLGN